METAFIFTVVKKYRFYNAGNSFRTKKRVSTQYLTFIIELCLLYFL